MEGRKTILVLLWCCMFYLGILKACAQTLAFDTIYLSFSELGTADGLPAGFVWNTLEDNEGRLLIATMDELSQYNGYTINKFPYLNPELNKINVGYLALSFIDKHGQIWLRSYNNNSYIFNQQNNTFHSTDIPLNFNSFTDEYGNIWFVKDNIWHIIDESHIPIIDQSGKNLNQLIKYKKASEFFADNSGLSFISLNPDFELQNYILSESIFWNNINDTLKLFTLDYLNKSVRLNTIIPLNNHFKNPVGKDFQVVKSRTQNHVHIIGTTGYLELETTTSKIRKIRKFEKPLEGLRVLLCDSKNRIWFTNNLNQLYLFDPDSDRLSKVKNFDLNVSLQYSIRLAYEDENHNIWFSTNGYGLYKYSIANERFQHIEHKFTTTPIGKISSNLKGDIIVESQNDYYFFEPKKKQLIRLTKGFYKTLNGTTKYNFIENNYVSDLDFIEATEKDRNTWGIRLRDSIYNDQNELNKIIGKVSYDRQITDENIGTWRIKISYASHSLDTIQVINQNTIDSLNTYTITTEYNLETLRTTCITDNGDIWLGFSKGGLFRFDYKQKTFEHLIPESGNKNSITSVYINNLRKDKLKPDSVLWICTSNGLLKYDIHEKVFSVYNENNGLPNNVINAIEFDTFNNIWISSNKGISLFNPYTLNIRNFDRKDGFPHDEFNKGSIGKSADGSLFFGRINGMTYFNPKDFYEDGQQSTISLENILLDNKIIKFNQDPTFNYKGFSLKSPFRFYSSIKIPYDFRMIGFEFALLDLTNPKSNRYKYKLEGFNDEWIDLNNTNNVTFTNLSPGRYKLTVKGCNHNDIWNDKGKSLEFIILTPWWLSWWFRSFIAFLILLIPYLYLKNKEKEKNKLQNLRNRISKDLHDEIGSTLSSISLFGTVAQKKLENSSPQVMKLLGKINDSSTHIMESMNDIVWAINSENDKIESLINRIRAYVFELLESTEWNIEFDIDESLLDTGLSMVAKRNLYLICKEAINNTVKYSRGTKLKIRFVSEKNMTLLEIMDNGIGFDINQNMGNGSLGGNGFKNMKMRAQEIHASINIKSEKTIGTTIQIRI